MFYNELKTACQSAAVELAIGAEKHIDNVKNYKPSEEFESAMQKVVKNEEEGTYSFGKKNTSIRVALVAAIISVVMVITCVAVNFKAEPEKKYLLTVYDKWTSVEHLDVRTQFYYSLVDYDFTPEYIPEGFELYEKQDNNRSCVYTYINKNGKNLIIQKEASGGVSNIDTEVCTYEEVIIDDIWVIIFRQVESDFDSYCCIFFKNSLKYTVTGADTREDLIKIVENLK